MQSECLKLDAAKSELYAVHLFTLQLGPARLCKLERSSLPSLVYQLCLLLADSESPKKNRQF